MTSHFDTEQGTGCVNCPHCSQVVILIPNQPHQKCKECGELFFPKSSQEPSALKDLKKVADEACEGIKIAREHNTPNKEGVAQLHKVIERRSEQVTELAERCSNQDSEIARYCQQIANLNAERNDQQEKIAQLTDTIERRTQVGADLFKKCQEQEQEITRLTAQLTGKRWAEDREKEVQKLLGIDLDSVDLCDEFRKLLTENLELKRKLQAHGPEAVQTPASQSDAEQREDSTPLSQSIYSTHHSTQESYQEFSKSPEILTQEFSKSPRESCDKKSTPLSQSDDERKEYSSGAVRSKDVDAFAYDLLSPIGTRRLARRYEFGRHKYGRFNCEKGFPINELLSHAINHCLLYLAGDRSDDHLAAAQWNCHMACHSEEANQDMNVYLGKDANLRFPKHETWQAKDYKGDKWYRELWTEHLYPSYMLDQSRYAIGIVLGEVGEKLGEGQVIYQGLDRKLHSTPGNATQPTSQRQTYEPSTEHDAD